MLAIKSGPQKKQQNGAALIAVLVILVVITLLGVTAMRMSLTSLTLATNSQINGLLFEAADKGMLDLRLAINQGNADADIAAAMKAGGIVGTRGEVAYCVTPSARANKGLTIGPCSTKVDADFMSSRKIIMSQVNYVREALIEGDTNAPAAIILGYGTGKAAGNLQDKLSIVANSVMPPVGSASEETINACLDGTSDYYQDAVNNPVGKPIADDTDNPDRKTITDCLTDKGAVFSTHVDEFLIGISL